MTVIRNAAAAAISLACLSSVSVHAQTRETVRARISYADLDLSSAAGRRSLDRRVHAAIQATCLSDAIGFAGKADEARCRAEMTRDGAAQIALMTRDRSVQVAALAR